MKYIRGIYNFYVDGFRDMKIGNTLWRLILIKLAIIFMFVKIFIHDKSLHSEYKSDEAKSEFVYKNLTNIDNCDASGCSIKKEVWDIKQ
jgi:hypothetical protein